MITRPLGATFADSLGVPNDLGGFGYGRGVISNVLAALTMGCVAYAASANRKSAPVPRDPSAAR